MNESLQCNKLIFEKPDAIILSTQRSGTHMLHESLASHPGIHGRYECVLAYQRWTSRNGDTPYPKRYIFDNKPGRINIGIVMYSEVAKYERLCGSIFDIPVIHLIRNALRVARSVAQLKTNRAFYGSEYKSHYKIGETAPKDLAINGHIVSVYRDRIRGDQGIYTRLLLNHKSLLKIRFEEITANIQTNAIPEISARQILEFLKLPILPLTNNLIKTGAAAVPAEGQWSGGDGRTII